MKTLAEMAEDAMCKHVSVRASRPRGVFVCDAACVRACVHGHMSLITGLPFCRVGTKEDFLEKTQLLSELHELQQKEKERNKSRQEEADADNHAERMIAVQLRADACARLGEKITKGQGGKDEPASKRRASGAMDGVLAYLERKRGDERDLNEERLLLERERLDMQDDERKKEQELKEQQLQLERRRLDLMEKEQQNRQQLEQQERGAREQRDRDAHAERLMMMRMMSALADKLG